MLILALILKLILALVFVLELAPALLSPPLPPQNKNAPRAAGGLGLPPGCQRPGLSPEAGDGGNRIGTGLAG